MINEQLRFLLPKAMLADLLIFVAALPFYGLNIQIPLGLLLGTAAMTATLSFWVCPRKEPWSEERQKAPNDICSASILSG